MTTLLSTTDLLNLAPGGSNDDAQYSQAYYINQLSGDVSNLIVGNPPGWGATIDTRFTVTDTGIANAISFTPTPAPASGDVLVKKQFWIVTVAAINTGATTVTVGVLPAVLLKKDDGAGTAIDLIYGDLLPQSPALIVYNGTEFLLANSASTSISTFTTELFR